MNRSEVVLCVGMHRSGTSLTASLLESLGIFLPGELITADVANQSGYFENRSIVDAQEKLLQSLGYWWPTEKSSHGMPESVVTQKIYKDYVDWLTTHLEKLLSGSHEQIGIKDPRTSLLMPAWRQAAVRLGIALRVVVCVREPRDVCWSLVWRDGPSVGMTWSRAQRLWIQHYKHLIHNLENEPAIIVSYEQWLDNDASRAQLQGVAKFIGRSCTVEQTQAALDRVKPEFNHGGEHQLPPVHKSLTWLHSHLIKAGTNPKQLVREADRSVRSLRRQQQYRAIRKWLHLRWLRTPMGRRSLGAAIDIATLHEQTGSTSLRTYRRKFLKHSDLRPHPLISPAHLNRERLSRGLKPIKSADDLFRHLLYPDLLPLNTHPWFDCRQYQLHNGVIGVDGPHPILSYLNNNLNQTRLGPVTKFPLPWLIALGAHSDQQNETQLPEFIGRLHPGLILGNPNETLGDPSDGQEQLVANERYWEKIHEIFELWKDYDSEGPLSWLSQQPKVNELGLTDQKPAAGYQLWWLTGHWEACLLAQVAGVEMTQSRQFSRPEILYEELIRTYSSSSESKQRVLVALTEPLLELFLTGSASLPVEVGFLNLVWPRPSQQSAWLHLLAKASVVVECRSAIRAYLKGLDLKAEWPRPRRKTKGHHRMGKPSLLLALEGGVAEDQLAAAAHTLNAERYDAILRLDAVLQLENPMNWLERNLDSHEPWLWLNAVSVTSNPKGHAVVAWAKHRGATLHILTDPPKGLWWEEII